MHDQPSDRSARSRASAPDVDRLDYVAAARLGSIWLLLENARRGTLKTALEARRRPLRQTGGKSSRSARSPGSACELLSFGRSRSSLWRPFRNAIELSSVIG